jgi:hypothetical protein
MPLEGAPMTSFIPKALTRVWSFITNGLTPSLQWVVGAILGAALLVHLCAGRIEEILKSLLDRHWNAAIVEFIGLFVLSLIGMALGCRAYRGATSHRLIAHLRGENAPPTDVLILPVSRPKRNEQSKFDEDLLRDVCELAKGNPEIIAWVGDASLSVQEVDLLAAFTNPHLSIDFKTDGYRFSAFSWTTGFKTVDYYLKTSQDRLRAIHLISSGDTAGLAEKYYKVALMRVIEKRIRKSGRNCETPSEEHWEDAEPHSGLLEIIAHRGVSYERFDEIQEKLQRIIEGETRRQSRLNRRACDVAIDVTGGSSAFSSAAAIEATRKHIIYSYIAPLTELANKTASTLNNPDCYDVIAESVGGAG